MSNATLASTRSARPPDRIRWRRLGQETGTRLASPVAEFARLRAIRGPVAGPPEVLATSATSETCVSPHWHAKQVRRPSRTRRPERSVRGGLPTTSTDGNSVTQQSNLDAVARASPSNDVPQWIDLLAEDRQLLLSGRLTGGDLVGQEELEARVLLDFVSRDAGVEALELHALGLVVVA